jgi:hypothetical protein
MEQSGAGMGLPKRQSNQGILPPLTPVIRPKASFASVCRGASTALAADAGRVAPPKG